MDGFGISVQSWLLEFAMTNLSSDRVHTPPQPDRDKPMGHPGEPQTAEGLKVGGGAEPAAGFSIKRETETEFRFIQFFFCRRYYAFFKG
jgi:hypothetical protein